MGWGWLEGGDPGMAWQAWDGMDGGREGGREGGDGSVRRGN